MNSFEFLSLTSVYFLALLSPGQDFFLILKHALSHGYKKAWWGCLGIACGNGVYIALAYMGHEHLKRYETLLSFISLGGALFLGYLGSLLLLAPKPHTLQHEHTVSISAKTLFYQGFFSAILNPKNILFYFSLLFTIVSAATPFGIKLFYALWMIGMLMAWDMLVAFLFGNKKALAYISYLYIVQKGIGLCLVVFSLHLLLMWFSAK